MIEIEDIKIYVEQVGRHCRIMVKTDSASKKIGLLADILVIYRTKTFSEGLLVYNEDRFTPGEHFTVEVELLIKSGLELAEKGLC